MAVHDVLARSHVEVFRAASAAAAVAVTVLVHECCPTVLVSSQGGQSEADSEAGEADSTERQGEALECGGSASWRARLWLL